MLVSQSVLARYTAFKLVFLQAVVVVVVAVIVLIVTGKLAGLSVLLGGSAYVLPNLYFALQLFTDTRARVAKRVVSRFFIGEIIKLLLSGLMVLLIVKYLPVNFLAFLIGYCVATLGYWLMPFVAKN